MFWNSYLYRHVCALTPARVMIRKTGIQNVDEMPLTRNNDCLKVGEEEESSAARPPHQQTEMQKLGGMRCTSKSAPRSCCEHTSWFGGSFLWKESDQHFRGIVQSFLIQQSHIWCCYYRWKTKLQRKAGQLTESEWKSMVSIKAIGKVSVDFSQKAGCQCSQYFTLYILQ